ncbi:hypothetical protein IID19_04760 [Patescibacteria group bacterium]|nr:hypothetical protein [Patescibacteria group bacterium]
MDGGNDLKKNQFWSGIVLVVVVIMLMGIYYLWVVSNIDEDYSSPPEIIINRSSEDSNPQLKTFQSEDYSFQIQYPGSWSVETNTSGEGADEIFSVGLSGDTEGVSISVMPESLEGIVRHSISITEETTIDLNGTSAQKLVGSNSKDGSIYTVVLVKYQEKIYSISGGGQMFDEIVNYFELL